MCLSVWPDFMGTATDNECASCVDIFTTCSLFWWPVWTNGYTGTNTVVLVQIKYREWGDEGQFYCDCTFLWACAVKWICLHTGKVITTSHFWLCGCAAPDARPSGGIWLSSRAIDRPLLCEYVRAFLCVTSQTAGAWVGFEYSSKIRPSIFITPDRQAHTQVLRCSAQGGRLIYTLRATLLINTNVQASIWKNPKHLSEYNLKIIWIFTCIQTFICWGSILNDTYCVLHFWHFEFQPNVNSLRHIHLI